MAIGAFADVTIGISALGETVTACWVKFWLPSPGDIGSELLWAANERNVVGVRRGVGTIVTELAFADEVDSDCTTCPSDSMNLQMP
jgi:hypothetical protein